MTSDRPPMYCLNCRYMLNHLPEHRCAECGREFDPTRPETYSQEPRKLFLAGLRKRKHILPIVCISLVWLSYFCSFSFFIMLIVPLGVLISWGRRRWLAGLCILLLTPVTIYFILGAASYVAGRPYLVTAGFSRNPSRVYRCPYRHYGDAMQDDAWVITLGNNLAVRTMVTLFGPARGSYTGPYPTAQEAQAALAAGSRVDVVRLCTKHQIQVDERMITLVEGTVWNIIMQTEWAVSFDDADKLQRLEQQLGSIRAAVWKETVLIVQTPSGKLLGPLNPIAVIDLKSGKPFAHYAEGSDGAAR